MFNRLLSVFIGVILIKLFKLAVFFKVLDDMLRVLNPYRDRLAIGN